MKPVPRVHLFYPENDLALARDIARYTAPPAAARLRRSGLTLPLWYGDAGDSFIAQGVDASWLGRMNDAFSPDIRPWDRSTEGLCPAPWGWSKASRQYFLDLGFRGSVMPDDKALDALRTLSHRRTASEVTRRLAETLPFPIVAPAEELTDVESIQEFIRSHPEGAVLKLPWSSSGRGLVATDPATAVQQTGMFEGMLRRQGSVMAEPRYRKVLDFAMLFTLSGGRCSYNGLSVFHNVQFGTYEGNTLASEAELWRLVASYCGEERLEAVRASLIPIIESIAGRDYDGPLGVDMMIADSPDTPIVPVSEINFRMTMGHLCHRFYSRYVADGAKGLFVVRANGAGQVSGETDASVRNGRMTGGVLDLAQPGCDFSFIIRLE